MKLFKLLPLLLFVSLLFVQCSPKRMQVLALSQTIENQRRNETDLLRLIGELDGKRKTQLVSGQIDSVVGVQTGQLLLINKKKSERSLAEVQRYSDSVLVFKNTRKPFQRGKFNKFSQRTLVRVDEMGNAMSEKVKDVSMAKDLFETSLYSKLELETFFGAGEFTISPNKSKEIETVLMPIVNQIVAFNQKYPNKKMRTTIVCNGYADPQPFDEQTNLYQLLAAQIGDQSPSREQLNTELSRLRANQIANLIKELIIGQDPELKNSKNASIELISIGKGEQMPPNYTPAADMTNDPNRRIVTLYWSVLPKNE